LRDSAAVSLLLQPLIAAQAEVLSKELQTMFAARLEEVFQPLRDLVASVQGWTDQVSGLWELMEALGGSLALTSSSAPGGHDEAASPVVASGLDACAAERDGVMVLATVDPPDDPPDLAFVRPVRVTQDAEEHAKVDVERVPSCFDRELSEVDSGRQLTLGELKASGVACTIKPSKELMHMDCDEPLERASPSSWGEFLEELALTVSSSSQNAQRGEAAPPLSERRSCRLDKKNKDCDIPVAKRAEFRRAEAFGEVPKIKSKGKASEEVLDEKMQHYLQMYKKQHTPQGIEAVRALVKANA
jgi:hypothetical protein